MTAGLLGWGRRVNLPLLSQPDPGRIPQIMYATGINDKGQIVANASGQALLLTPN